MAKLNWEASVICFEMDEKTIRQAKNVPMETRQYLQHLKFIALDKLRKIDPASTSRDALIELAKVQERLNQLDEILSFLAKSQDNFGE